jgi:hypothetical protein
MTLVKGNHCWRQGDGRSRTVFSLQQSRNVRERMLTIKEPIPMKRLAPLALVTLFGIAILGAAQGIDKGDKGDDFDNPYYPLKVGTTWEYAGGGKKVIITVKTHEDVPGSGKCAVLETDSGGGKLTEHLAVKGDGIYRVRANGKDVTPPVLVLRLPLKKGEEWKVDSKSDNNEITGKWTVAAEEKLTVGKDEYRTAYLVKSTDLKMGLQSATAERWYAKDRGMVKYNFRIPSAGVEVSLELEKFTAGK